MTIQNFDPIAGTVNDLVDFCERMEHTEGTPESDKKKEDKLMKTCIPCKKLRRPRVYGVISVR